MSQPNPISLEFVQGDTLDLYVQWNEEDTGDPVDITDATITADVRKEYTTDVECSFSVSKTDAVNGQFSLSLSPAQTAALPPRRKSSVTSFVFDINVAFDSGVNLTPVYGYLKMTREVTI